MLLVVPYEAGGGEEGQRWRREGWSAEVSLQEGDVGGGGRKGKEEETYMMRSQAFLSTFAAQM